MIVHQPLVRRIGITAVTFRDYGFDSHLLIMSDDLHLPIGISILYMEFSS